MLYIVSIILSSLLFLVFIGIDGSVSLRWHDYYMESDISVFFIFCLLLFLLFVMLSRFFAYFSKARRTSVVDLLVSVLSYMKTEDVKFASKTIKKIGAAIGYKAPIVCMLMAQIDIMEANYNKARERLFKLLDSNLSFVALTELSNLALIQKDVLMMEQILVKAKDLYPDRMSRFVELEREIFVKYSRWTDLISLLEGRGEDASVYRYIYVQSLFKEEKYREALNQIQLVHDKSVDMLLMETSIYSALKKHSNALSSLEYGYNIHQGDINIVKEYVHIGGDPMRLFNIFKHSTAAGYVALTLIEKHKYLEAHKFLEHLPETPALLFLKSEIGIRHFKNVEEGVMLLRKEILPLLLLEKRYICSSCFVILEKWDGICCNCHEIDTIRLSHYFEHESI